MEHLFLWRIETLEDGLFELHYNSWFRVQLICSGLVITNVQLAILPTLRSQQSQFPIVNDVLVALGHREIMRLKKKSPLSVSELAMFKEVVRLTYTLLFAGRDSARPGVELWDAA